MPRHHIGEPRVRSVVDRLIDQFLRLGSVNALAEALTEAQPVPATKIYANRLHGLLGEDVSRSVNTGTLEAIERGLAGLEATHTGSADPAIYQRVVAALDEVPAGAEDPVRTAANSTALPVAVVRRITALSASTSRPEATYSAVGTPDWSWQDDAIRESLRALRKGPRYKAGLVVPTGGGKTKIALQVALRWLALEDREDSVILLVTHRRRLHLQARRALQRLLHEPGAVPDGAAALFASRIRFVMIGDVESAIAACNDSLALMIVDEAHHAAAPSYEPIFSDALAPGLFLTATPSRADELPIGINEICYTITYRALLERGCLVTPIFEPALDLHRLDWSAPEGLRDLADYLLDRSEEDFRKVLVTVSTRERAEVLYESVLELLDQRGGHPLTADDVGYVHAERSSGGINSADFLDEFTARPNGVLVATGQLIGEGFDDPSIDAVVVAYPSTSISHLMQVAGRALRWAPGKSLAHVVQVRESPMEYHFDQRWLYQDISDQLRPELVDRRYASAGELYDQVEAVLDAHQVPSTVRRRILDTATKAEPGVDLRIMLTGVPYFGERDTFSKDAEWGAILVTPEDERRFIHIFNDVSARFDDIKEHGLYLAQFVDQDSRAGSVWKSYVDLVTAMEYARREIMGTPYAGQSSRPYRKGLSTTWLRYVTLSFAPTVPAVLDAFLADALNRDQVVAAYLAAPESWAAASKIELPLTGTFALLLGADQATWLEYQRSDIVDRLRNVGPLDALQALDDWAMRLPDAPVPLALVREMGQLTRPERFTAQYLRLHPPAVDEVRSAGTEGQTS